MWISMLCSSFNDVLNPLVTFLLNVYSLVFAMIVGIDGFFFFKTKNLHTKNPKIMEKNPS